MIDLDDTFIIDSIVHAYNTDPSNHRNDRHASVISDMIYAPTTSFPEECQIDKDSWMRDCSVEELANMLFLESNTDMATFQVLPLTAYKDDLTSVAKAEEVVERWPDRFLIYASVDPTRDDAVKEIEEQIERLDLVGVKFYPSSWTEEGHTAISVSDPDVAFPIYEKALDMGIDKADFHASLPFGPISQGSARRYYNPEEIGEAVETFPEMDFSMVHGGAGAFAEETAWMLVRFPDVHLNLEAFGWILTAAPRKAAEVLATIIGTAGEQAFDDMFWSSAAMASHPRPQLEALRDFQFPDDILNGGGVFVDVPQITDEHKRKILGENYAEFMDIDIEDRRQRIADDEFSQERGVNGLAEGYATTDSEAIAD
jgi:predicted TIM-barrel fold metal-dependent hydrolase